MSPAEVIQAEITAIEQANDVTVLYACEAGSRAWGFDSAQSDYDVRFLYLRRPQWYLSIEVGPREDVLQRQVDEQLDVSGWDLRKALGLLRKSNPSLLEWLGSPIIYRDDGVAAEQLRALAAQSYSKRAIGCHYLRMAKTNVRKHLMGAEVLRKRYFHVLRPLLALRWLRDVDDSIPAEFSRLLERYLPSGEVRDAIDELLVEKRSGTEQALGPRVDVLHAFVESELQRAESSPVAPAASPVAIESCDRLFRMELARVYGLTLS